MDKTQPKEWYKTCNTISFDSQAPYKGIILHGRVCCNPCMGCGFREVIRT